MSMPTRKKMEIPDKAWLETLKFLVGHQWLKMRFVSPQIAEVVRINISELPHIIITIMGSWPSIEHFLNLRYNPLSYIKKVQMHALNQNFTDHFFLGEEYGSYIRCGNFTLIGDLCKSLSWMQKNVRADTISFPGEFIDVNNSYKEAINFLLAWMCADQAGNVKIEFDSVNNWILIKKFRTFTAIQHATPSIEFHYKCHDEKHDLNFVDWDQDVVEIKSHDSMLRTEAVYVVSNGRNRMEIAIFKRCDLEAVKMNSFSGYFNSKITGHIYDVTVKIYTIQPAIPSREKLHILVDASLDTLEFLSFPQWSKEFFVFRQLARMRQENISRVPCIVFENAIMTENEVTLLNKDLKRIGTTIFNFVSRYSDAQGQVGNVRITAIDEMILTVKNNANVRSINRSGTPEEYTKSLAELVESSKDHQTKYVQKQGFFVAVAGMTNIHGRIKLIGVLPQTDEAWKHTIQLFVKEIAEIEEKAGQNLEETKKKFFGQVIVVNSITAASKCYTVDEGVVDISEDDNVVYGLKAENTEAKIRDFCSDVNNPKQRQQILDFVQGLADEIITCHNNLLKDKKYKVKPLISSKFCVAIHEIRDVQNPRVLTDLPFVGASS